MTPEQATENLFQAAVTCDAAAAIAALDAGADVNSKDKWQHTPLHWASYYGQTDLVRLLIENGADPTAKDRWQKTPQYRAACHGNTNIVEMLEVAIRQQPGHTSRVEKQRGSSKPQIGG